MSDENIFDEVPAETPSPVETLVGEGKKFKTVEDLAKAKLESDRYIETLKSELNEVKTQAGQRADLEEQFTQLRDEIVRLKAARQPTETKENTPPALSETDVEALVTRVMTRQEAARSAGQNIAEANRQVLAAHGTVEKAKEAVRAKATELGLSVADLQATASRSPTAFLKLVLDKVPAQTRVDLSRSSINTDSVQLGSGPKPGSKAAFEKIRKEDPKRYYSEDTYQQIEAALKAGLYK